MSDSFFGFNTTLPGDDEALRDDEDSELEYDALNDETFGSAIKGDWEDLHENLVQLERSVDDDDEELAEMGGKATTDAQRDAFRNDFHSLEQDLLRLGLRNMPSANYDDCESRITLDPSVWAPPPPPVTRSVPNTGPGHGMNIFGHPQPPPSAGEPFPGMFQQQNMGGGGGGGGMKMCTLEDIERNMRSQPTPVHSNGHQNSNNNNSLLEANSLFPPVGVSNAPGGGGSSLNAPSRLPPGFGPPGGGGGAGGGMKMFPPHNHPMFPPMNHHPQQQQQQRHGYPPMMPPHPSAGGPHSPNHYNKRLVMEIQQTHPLLAYNRMNHPGMPPGPPGPPGPQGPPPHHPMFMPPHLYHSMHHHQPPTPPQPPMGMHQHLHHPHLMNGGGGGNNGPQQQSRGYSPMGARDGNLSLTRQLNGESPDAEGPRDEYRNLMTPRDKQWLIGIQLLQLNTETPYVDDYYYAVYRQRKLRGRKENKCHKDNQLNHPFSQPQGHAQLVLQSIGNRNHQQNNRHSGAGGGAGGRDRKMSESSSRNGGDGKSQGGNNNNDQQSTPRTYTPLQFENSLGKLQCGSVTAPRKIIDMEIVAAEAGSGAALEGTAQRRCRHLLLNIETAFRVVLKLEDLSNPMAVEAFALLREKRERERKIALEQQAEREKEAAAQAAEGGVTKPVTTTTTTSAVVVAPGGGRLNIDSVATAAAGEEKARLGEETREELQLPLIQSLADGRVYAMMMVRKGRRCVQRAMMQMDVSVEAVNEAVWSAWTWILLAAPVAAKKEKDEVDAQLMGLCEPLVKHVATAEIKQLLAVARVMERNAAALFSLKFGVCTMILMLQRAEDLFEGNTLTASQQLDWRDMVTGFVGGACLLNRSEKPKPRGANYPTLNKVAKHLKRFPTINQTMLLDYLSSTVTEANEIPVC